jgi:hypothetical protein
MYPALVEAIGSVLHSQATIELESGIRKAVKISHGPATVIGLREWR